MHYIVSPFPLSAHNNINTTYEIQYRGVDTPNAVCDVFYQTFGVAPGKTLSVSFLVLWPFLPTMCLWEQQTSMEWETLVRKWLWGQRKQVSVSHIVYCTDVSYIDYNHCGGAHCKVLVPITWVCYCRALSNKYFELKTRGAAAPTRNTCSLRSLLCHSQ